MKNKKIINNNTDKFELSRERTWADAMHPEAVQEFPSRAQWRERLIYTLQKWSYEPDSLEMSQFCNRYKIYRQRFHDWAEKYPDIHKAYTEAKRQVAANRRIGVMTRKLDGVYAYRDMHRYDPEWHEVNKYHADMKRNAAPPPSTINVYADKPKVKTKEDLQKEIDGLK